MKLEMRDVRWLTRLAIVPVAFSFAFAACGGDSDSGSSGATGGTTQNASGGSSNGTGGKSFDTGLDDDKQLDELTPDEQQQLCDKTEALVDDVLPAEKLCQLMGIFTGLGAQLGDPGAGGASGLGGAPAAPSGDPQAACEEAQTACLAAPTETTTECNVPADCSATVGEWEACLNDMNALMGGALKGVYGCDNVLLSLLALQTLAQPPASCDVVDEKCPGALDGLQPLDTSAQPTPL